MREAGQGGGKFALGLQGILRYTGPAHLSGEKEIPPSGSLSI